MKISSIVQILKTFTMAVYSSSYPNCHPLYSNSMLNFNDVSGCTGSVVVPDQEEGGKSVSSPEVSVSSPEVSVPSPEVSVRSPELVVVHPLEDQTGIAGLAVNSSLEGEVRIVILLTS
jgi:hypothetical protein